jgi:DNA-binding transcriptional LysR family regulator
MTHAGVAFKRHVDALMHELDDGLAAVHQLVDPETGTVTLSFQQSLGTWLVPDLVASFRREHPEVRFDLRLRREELVSTVQARGDVDLELSTVRPHDPAVRWRGLVPEPLRLAVPADSPLAAREEVSLAEAADVPFVALRPTSLLRQLSDELCERAGFGADVAFECDDVPTAQAFVAAGLGVAILPAATGADAGASGARLRHLRLTDRGAVREVTMAWSAERRLLPAAELFRAHLAARADAGELRRAHPR